MENNHRNTGAEENRARCALCNCMQAHLIAPKETTPTAPKQRNPYGPVLFYFHFKRTGKSRTL